MNRKFCVAMTTLFCAFLLLFGTFLIIRPAQGFSEMENRYLQTFPELSLKEIASGDFMSKFETFVTDQFPGRDGWVAVKTWSERLSGKKENNGIYFGTDGKTLFANFTVPDAARVDKNLNHVSEFAGKTEVPVYFALIPDKASVWSRLLPANAPVTDETELLRRALTSTGAVGVDLYTPLNAAAGEYIYYRTDHHWTTLGAYFAYAAVMEEMGITPVPLSDYEETVVSDRFYGTSYSASGARWVPADSISLYVPDSGISVISYFTGRPEAGKLYDLGYLEVKDQYSLFLGGNQPLCVVKTGNADAPKLAIVRDSFADCMVPFLTAHFSEIHLIDPRYNMNSVSDYITRNDIDLALVLYSASNFAADINLFVLGR